MLRFATVTTDYPMTATVQAIGYNDPDRPYLTRSGPSGQTAAQVYGQATTAATAAASDFGAQLLAFLKKNQTAVYLTAGGLVLLAVLRGSRR